MYDEWFLHTKKLLENDISFSLKVQMAQAKMNLYLSLSIYSVFFM